MLRNYYAGSFIYPIPRRYWVLFCTAMFVLRSMFRCRTRFFCIIFSFINPNSLIKKETSQISFMVVSNQPMWVTRIIKLDKEKILNGTRWKTRRPISQKMISISCYGKQAYPANFSCFGTLIRDLNKTWKDRKWCNWLGLLC